MAKIDKSQFSKEEWRRIKEQRRLEKLAKQQEIQVEIVVPLVPKKTINEEKTYVLCLKHGKKYGPEYVNTLYNMVQRHCTIAHEFVCLTDDDLGLDPRIKILPLPSNLSGWWCKPYMFSKDLPLNGTILYMDLDVVISSSIDKLFTYQQTHWCTIRDFTRAMRPGWPKYNSSIIRFRSGELDFVWEGFKKNPKDIQRRYFGDQDYLFEATRKYQAAFYPDSWVQSWKWEVRKTKDFAPGSTRGNRKFRHIEHVTPRIECCVCVFHGDPNPHNCEDPWVIRNWI